MGGAIIQRAAVAAAALALAACGSTAATTGGQAGGAGGSNLPTFQASDLDGGLFSLSDHLGKDVVLISFWATYCEPCKAEMPVLQHLHETYAPKGLAIVSVSLDGPDTVAGVKPFIRRQRYTFPVVVDEDTAIAQAYNPTAAAPFTVLIGRDGKVAKRIEGFQPSEAGELEATIARLLARSAGLAPAATGGSASAAGARSPRRPAMCLDTARPTPVRARPASPAPGWSRSSCGEGCGLGAAG
ncbi:MAG: resA protein [Proteobacteria bacterium]|nr:MAG: resA protein [Pseudomonadota bacterium]